MGSNDLDLEIQIAEEEAKAKKKRLATAQPAPTDSATMAVLKAIPYGASEIATIPNSLANLYAGSDPQGITPGGQIAATVAKYTPDRNTMNKALSFLEAGANPVPNPGTTTGKILSKVAEIAEQAALNPGRFAGNFIAGSGGELAGQAADYAGANPMQQAAARLGGGVVSGMAAQIPGQALKAVRNGIWGKPAEQAANEAAVNLYEQSRRPSIFAEKLNTPETNAGGQARVADMARSSDTFANANPLAGVDLNDTRSVAQVVNKLKGIGADAGKKLGEVLDDAAQGEVALLNKSGGKVGITWGSVNDPSNKGTAALEALRAVSPQEVETAENIAKAHFFDNTPGGFQPKTLSAREAWTARKAVDQRLNDLKQYDANVQGQAGVNPSRSSEAEIKALNIIRGNLSDAMENHIKSMGDFAGQDLLSKWKDANAQYKMVSDYLPEFQRFDLETGKAFSNPIPQPAAQAGMPSNRSVRQTVVDTAANINPEGKQRDAQIAAESQALQRGPQAMQQLAQLINFRTGATPPPLARDWNSLKGSDDFLRFGILATNMGMVAQPQDIQKLPDAMGKKLVGQIVQMAPELFDKSESGYQSETSDHVLHSPQDRDAHAEEIAKLPPKDRAKAMTSLIEENKWTPLEKNQQEPSPMTMAQETDPLGRFSSAPTNYMPQQSGIADKYNTQHDFSDDGNVLGMLEKMARAEQEHAN